MKRLFLINAIILAVLTTGVFALIACVKLNAVHQFALNQVNKAIPGKISLGRLKLSLLDLRVEIRDLGLCDSAGNDLAGLDKAILDVSMRNLLKRKLIVEKVVVVRPYASLEFDTSGQLLLLNAFPKGKEKPADTSVVKSSKPFLIELKDFNLSGGKVLFSSVKDSLVLLAHGLSISAKGKTDSLSADLSFSLDSASLSRNGNPLFLNKLAILARVRGMDLDTVSLGLSTVNTVLTLNGKASSLDNDPAANLSLDVNTALSEIRSIAGIKEPLSGDALLRVELSGKIADPDIDMAVNYDGGSVWGYPVESLFLKSRVAGRLLHLDGLRAETQSGSIKAGGTVDLRRMFPQGFLAAPGSAGELVYDLSVTGENVTLQKLVPGISGTASLSLGINGHGVKPDSLSAQLDISANVEKLMLTTDKIDTSAVTRMYLPLDASLACSATVSRGTASLYSLKGKLGETSLHLSGTYGILSGKTEADLALSLPSLNELLRFTGTDSIYGSADASIRIGGDLKHPEAVIGLEADSLAFKNVHIGSVHLDGGLNSEGTAIVKELRLAKDSSQLQLSGSAQVLQEGKILPPEKMTFDVSLMSKGISVGDYLDSAAGKVTIDARLGGTTEDPSGTLALSASKLFASGQSLDSLCLRAQIGEQRVNIQPLRLIVDAGQDLTVTGWAGIKDSFDIKISAPGINLNSIAALSAVDSIDGVFSMEIQADGSYKNPGAEGKLAIDNIRMGSLPLDKIGLLVTLADNVVKVNGKVLGDVDASYNLGSKDYKADLSFNNLLLTPYLALSKQKLEGALTAAIKVTGNTDSLNKIAGKMDITSLNIEYQDIPVIETRELKASLTENRYSVPDFSIMLAGEGALSGHAQGLLEGPHDIELKGLIPLSIARHFTPDLPDIEGSVSLDASLKGMAEDPALSANLELKSIAMTVPGITQHLHSVNGRIKADRKAVRIEKLQGNLDDGVFRMKGRLGLDELKPSNLNAEVIFEALPLGQPDMLDMEIDGKLKINGTPDTTHVTGDIVLLDGLYYKDLTINPLSIVGGERKRKEAPVPQESTVPYLKNMRLDVGVQARSPFRVDNNIAQLTIAPDIQVTGSISSPSINGRANVEEGTITYLKKVFTVERGIVDFVNPYRIEPKIDILGVVPVRDWEIQIVISGTPEDLVFKLASDDQTLEDQDLLSLLVLGKTTSELQSDIGSMAGGQSNQQMLASLVASTFGEEIKTAAGLDILKVETGDENDENSDRISVTMGKQITRRLGTSYTIESQGSEALQRASAQYRILQNLLLEVFQEYYLTRTEDKGAYGGQVRFTWEKR
ncbi:MAG: hypothetical protein GX556_13525 [Fibrobacter sp.]|nr:hypothetical protein [Fibrobacter sp.]